MTRIPGIDEDVTVDRLAGDWTIHQLAAGHRFSADDMLVAWLAAKVEPDARRLLDLGAGIGSVGYMTLWALRDRAPGVGQRRLTMVEAQPVSQQLAFATAALNGLEGLVDGFVADLRELPAGVFGPYDLVTGSPPYFPLGTGKVSPHPQKAACRMELRGTIADYALAAAPLLGEGSFVTCFPARDPRGEAAFAPAGLHVYASCDVVFRAGMDPMIRLYAARRAPCVRAALPTLTIRDRTGAWTPQYLDLRAEMGSPMPPASGPPPGGG